MKKTKKRTHTPSRRKRVGPYAGPYAIQYYCIFTHKWLSLGEQWEDVSKSHAVQTFRVLRIEIPFEKYRIVGIGNKDRKVKITHVCGEGRDVVMVGNIIDTQQEEKHT